MIDLLEHVSIGLVVHADVERFAFSLLGNLVGPVFSIEQHTS